MNDKKKSSQPKQEKDTFNAQRREFLRTSMYAAYATPVIMSVLVEKASAGSSGVVEKNKNCADPAFACSNQQACQPPPGMCP
ncbi:MAG: hypothetical protein M8357_12455 [Desulfobulbaceae bacterium]|nr:hypothetical protein [Desulfobulbaceae bacterium]